MMNKFITKAVLEYTPKLLGGRESKQNWLIAYCDGDIGAYYRELYRLSVYKSERLLRPAWKEHITIVRDEEPPNICHWDKYQGQEIEIAVILDCQNNGNHFWLPVESPTLLAVRYELGLGEPLYPLHLTIGNLEIKFN